jgi:hypothetical protein
MTPQRRPTSPPHPPSHDMQPKLDRYRPQLGSNSRCRRKNIEGGAYHMRRFLKARRGGLCKSTPLSQRADGAKILLPEETR